MPLSQTDFIEVIWAAHKILVWKHYHYSRQSLLVCSSLILTELIPDIPSKETTKIWTFTFIYGLFFPQLKPDISAVHFTELLWHVSRKTFTLFIPDLKLCLFWMSMQSFFNCYHFFSLFMFYPFLILFKDFAFEFYWLIKLHIILFMQF